MGGDGLKNGWAAINGGGGVVNKWGGSDPSANYAFPYYEAQIKSRGFSSREQNEGNLK